MQGIILHGRAKPPLKKGSMILPIPSWKEGEVAISTFRRQVRRQSRGGANYITLVQVPEDHSVAVVVGTRDFKVRELEYFSLSSLPREDITIMREYFSRFRKSRLSEAGAEWLAYLVLGESLPRSSVKWTKDFRLLKQGAKNPATKRT